MINPALESKWSTEVNGKVFTFTIAGIWSTGIKDRFQVISYEIKYDHLEQIQLLPAEKMNQLLVENRLVHLATC